MINIRFHLVSLVAVFLALGVGVVMGASFIDRATVDSMRGRVDDLEVGYRDRGDQLDAYRDMLAGSDDAASALTDEASRATDGTLAGESVVVVVPSGTAEDSVAAVTDAVVNGGADLTGTLELQPDLAPEDDLTDEEEGALRSALDGGEDGGANGDVAPEDLVVTARETLADALATLSAVPPAGTEPEAGNDGAVTAGDVDAARDVLERFSEAGLLVVNTGGLASEVAFPTTTGVRYVVVAAEETEPSSTDWVVPFVEDYGEQSVGSMVAIELGPLRAAGDLPEPDAEDAAASVLEPLRTGAASNEVSTVGTAAEPLARVAVVYALSAQSDGIVGHYGLGDGVTDPYPPAAQE